MRVGLVVFDVGGTTVKDSADVAAVFASALERYGIATSPEPLRAWRGASKRAVIEELVTAGGGARLDPSEVYRTFQRLLIDGLTTQGVKAIPGVEAAFGILRQHGVRLMLVTGFDARVMRVLLEELGWESVVDGAMTLFEGGCHADR